MKEFNLLKSEIKKVEKAAKCHTGKKCFLAGIAYSVDPVRPDWVDVTCEMDAVEDGAFCCNVEISCYMEDRRRSFISRTTQDYL